MSVYQRWILVGVIGALSSCSPLKTSANDERHQLELTLHEVQTNLDDLRHDINCFQTELQILDGRIKYYENTLSTLKTQDLEKQEERINYLSEQIDALKQRSLSIESAQREETSELKELSLHADETVAALSQFRNRIYDLEKEINSQNNRFDEMGKMKKNIENLVKGYQGRYKIYRVKAGDSLEKIARMNKSSVEKIQEANKLKQDLIVIGQELKIPLD